MLHKKLLRENYVWNYYDIELSSQKRWYGTSMHFYKCLLVIKETFVKLCKSLKKSMKSVWYVCKASSQHLPSRYVCSYLSFGSCSGYVYCCQYPDLLYISCGTMPKEIITYVMLHKDLGSMFFFFC